MKKILFLLLLTVVFVSCDDTDNGWGSRPGVDDTQNWDSYVVTIKSTDWERVGNANSDNSYYRCFVDDKFLDNNIFNNGTVMVYMVQDGGKVLTPLPYVLHKADGDNLWTETITYDYSVGSLAFYVTYSDFATQNRPGGYQFKVVMHW